MSFHAGSVEHFLFRRNHLNEKELLQNQWLEHEEAVLKRKGGKRDLSQARHGAIPSVAKTGYITCMQLDISNIAADFPDFRVATIIASGLEIVPERPAALDRFIEETEAECRRRWAGFELSEIPGIAVWRRAYRQFGIKKTSYRCSVERLVKNVLADRALPRINSFVDAYNAISLAFVLPCGADDLDHVRGSVAFRYARPGDTFLDMSAEGQAQDDPPKTGEVVYADEEKVLCRRWNWRQDMRSLVTPQTRHALVTIQSNGEGELHTASDLLCDLLADHCGAACQVGFHGETDDRPHQLPDG